MINVAPRDIKLGINFLKQISDVQNGNSLEEILESTRNLFDGLGFRSEIYIKEKYKHNLVSSSDNLSEFHIDPLGGPLEKTASQFEPVHEFFYSKNDPNYYVLNTKMPSYLADSESLNLFPLSRRNGRVHYEGAVVLGASSELSSKSKELVDVISTTLANSLFRLNAEYVLSTIDKIQTLPEFSEDVLLNNSYGALMAIKKIFSIAAKEDISVEDVNKLAKYRGFVDSSINNIADFVNSISEYAKLSHMNFSKKTVFSLSDIFLDKNNEFDFDLQYLGVNGSSKIEYNKSAIDGIVTQLLSNQRNEPVPARVLLMDRGSEYRVIVRLNGEIPVEKFKVFFEPETVDDYKHNMNSAKAYLLAEKVGIDMWLNSPKNSGFHEVIFNLKKYA